MSDHRAWVPKHAFCLSDHWKVGGVWSGAHVVGYPRKKGGLYVYWGGNVVRLLIFRERDHDGSSISLSPLWRMDFGRAPLAGHLPKADGSECSPCVSVENRVRGNPAVNARSCDVVVHITAESTLGTLK